MKMTTFYSLMNGSWPSVRKPENERHAFASLWWFMAAEPSPSQTSVFAFKQPPALSMGVHFKQWRILFWGLIMNQWLSEAERELTDSLNSKLNMCCSFSNTKWVTVPVTHWGVVVEIEIRSCKNLGWVTVWSFMLLRGLYNATTSCLPNDISPH